MVKHTQTIRRMLATNCLSVFKHFVGLALKSLITTNTKNVTLPSELGSFLAFTLMKDYLSKPTCEQNYSDKHSIT